MTLWNIIRDFFVDYIFGGINSHGEGASNFLGNVDIYINGEFEESLGTNTNEVFGFKVGNVLTYGANGDIYMTIGDWLSTTATIITLCAICFFLFLFVRWLFRLTAGLIQARG